MVTGETDKVLDQLEPLLRTPSYISSGWASDEGLVLMEPERLAGAQLEKWVDRAAHFADSLPPK